MVIKYLPGMHKGLGTVSMLEKEPKYKIEL